MALSDYELINPDSTFITKTQAATQIQDGWRRDFLNHFKGAGKPRRVLYASLRTAIRNKLAGAIETYSEAGQVRVSRLQSIYRVVLEEMEEIVEEMTNPSNSTAESGVLHQ